MARRYYRLYSPIFFTLSLFISVSCSLGKVQENISQSDKSITPTTNQVSDSDSLTTGVQICPDTYFEIDLIQDHKLMQYNFNYNISATGILPLEEYETENASGLKTTNKIPVSGGGLVGLCSFDITGFLVYQLDGKLIPGTGSVPDLKINGRYLTSLETQPSCGDLVVLPLDEPVDFLIPYRDGEVMELDWEYRSAGISGRSNWVLHIPCIPD